MSRYGTMLVHLPWGGRVGTARQLREKAEEIQECESRVVQIYAERTDDQTRISLHC